MSATTVGIFLGIVLFDLRSLLSFRPLLLDLPMMAWCLIPLASSLDNGLGVRDGMSGIVSQCITWGLPYLFGRLYFVDLQGLRELAAGIFIGGLIYVPLCLYEIRMSPQLHKVLYGEYQHSFIQTMRFGGYRPMVFMRHGLAVSLWMSVASVVGCWLWVSGTLKQVARIPMSGLVPLLMGTTVLCKSLGAVALMVIALATLFAVRMTQLRVVVLAAILAAPVYMAVRATGVWTAGPLMQFAELFGREDSLGVRLESEQLLVEHALDRPLLGWGGWGRNRVIEGGQDLAITDGLWVIVLGQRGVTGLVIFTTLILLPVVLLWRHLHPRYWAHPLSGPAAALAMVLVMFMIDSQLNSMFNPFYAIAGGGLTALAARVTAPGPHRVSVSRPAIAHAAS